MDLIWDGLGEAVRIIQNGKFDVWDTAIRSLFISGSATAISLFLGILVGSLIAFNQFPGRNLAFSLVNTGMGLPPVIVGLMVAIMLWRSGPLGVPPHLHADCDDHRSDRHRSAHRHGVHGGRPA